MEFKLTEAKPGMTVFQNEYSQKVVITDRRKNPVLASKSLMSPQIDAVLEGHHKGLQVVRC